MLVFGKATSFVGYTSVTHQNQLAEVDHLKLTDKRTGCGLIAYACSNTALRQKLTSVPTATASLCIIKATIWQPRVRYTSDVSKTTFRIPMRRYDVSDVIL
jgi:hypothetical protein